jgi:hypothetical protein
MGNSEEQDKAMLKIMKPMEPLIVNNHKSIMLKMDQIQHEIGLTDDEVIIIVFTSMDMEFFNHLVILQGEFNKWFNLNFEGESQEEIDFLQNKQEAFMQAVS